MKKQIPDCRTVPKSNRTITKRGKLAYIYITVQYTFLSQALQENVCGVCVCVSRGGGGVDQSQCKLVSYYKIAFSNITFNNYFGINFQIGQLIVFGIVLGIVDPSIVVPPRIMESSISVEPRRIVEPPIRTILLLDGDVTGSDFAGLGGIY